MTDNLEAAITQVEQLSEEDQDAIAEAMLILIDEIGWEKRFAQPENQQKMQRMAEAALEEYDKSDTEQ